MEVGEEGDERGSGVALSGGWQVYDMLRFFPGEGVKVRLGSGVEYDYDNYLYHLYPILFTIQLALCLALVNMRARGALFRAREVDSKRRLRRDGFNTFTTFDN